MPFPNLPWLEFLSRDLVPNPGGSHRTFFSHGKVLGFEEGKFRDSLVYIVSPRIASATERDPVSKQKEETMRAFT